MKILLLGLFVLIPTLASASVESALEICKTMPVEQRMACVNAITAAVSQQESPSKNDQRPATSSQHTSPWDQMLDYCHRLQDKGERDRCVRTIEQDQRNIEQSQVRAQQQEREAQYAQQQELARQQALGMALFGSGQALINGMNQGFNNMRIPPPQTYQPVPLPQYQSPQRNLNCTSYQSGNIVTTNCY